jgi:hypothetical protein
MGTSTKEDKIFKNEIAIFTKHKDLLIQENAPEQMKESWGKLTHEYKKLLEQTRFLTWVSGRLEKKLQKSNRDLQDKNKQLEQTVQDLLTAKAGRSAYAIIYFIAIVLFVLEELVLDPFIKAIGNGLAYSIMFKLIIVLMLKIAETVIEDRIKKKSAKKIIAPTDK